MSILHITKSELAAYFSQPIESRPRGAASNFSGPAFRRKIVFLAIKFTHFLFLSFYPQRRNFLC